jgi:hypothetical protein
MVDFGSLAGTEKEIVEYDLEKLYASLDVKGTHTEARPAQREAMLELSKRHSEKDIVLKVSTGAGKTTIGLLYLFGHMKLQGAPVVYLCPTVQLVEQVVEEAARLGIAAFSYPSGEPYPNAACVRGAAIIVCTYEKLFNAKSTFLRNDVNIVPYAIALDDAHAGAENVRKQFTVQVQGEAFDALCSKLEARCKAYHPTKWMDIELSDPLASLEVPHWIWTDASKEVRTALHEYADTTDFKFAWPYLESILPLCRCVIAAGRAEIAPDVLPTHMVRPFSQASHRLFMSATLADDSLLTRELGASAHATSNPILPPSDRGLGERMIIAPSLIDPDLDRGYAMSLCAELSKAYNVVVLTSSEFLARDWVAVGAQYFASNSFSEGVRRLRDPKSGIRFAVFAQRYDGVDLPDDACRVLVIDGLPHGESLIDRADAYLAFSPGGVRNRTVYRIEQGMGRPVRSHADYAVVLLVGQDLATYVGRKDVLEAMTPDTRNQLELSIELAELVRRSNPKQPELAIRQVLEQCLGRDAGWKEFYKKRVRDVAKHLRQVDSSRIDLANEERESHILATGSGAGDGAVRFQRAINALKVSEEELGILLQRLARMMYLVDPAEALKIQQGARDRCVSVALPPAAPRKPAAPGAKTVAQKFCAWFKHFTSGNAAALEAKRIVDSLNLDGKPRTVERAVKDLGDILGADSAMPEDEYGRGPDNLWFWGGMVLVIEVKNENEESLHKSDSGQLHDSLAWARGNFPEFGDRLIPVIVANVTKADSDAHFPEGTRVLGAEGCSALGTAIYQLCQKLAKEGPVFVTPENVLSEMGKYGLLPEQFAGRHTKKLE